MSLSVQNAKACSFRYTLHTHNIQREVAAGPTDNHVWSRSKATVESLGTIPIGHSIRWRGQKESVRHAEVLAIVARYVLF